jgi:folate-binding protein YgfZ
MPSPILLVERAIVSVNGPDAESFLQGLLTQDVLGLEPGGRRYAALLTPQGKIIGDMILERTSDGFLLDSDAVAAPQLAKRLKLFKLRAAVTIGERDDLCVVAFEGAPDPRSPSAPLRRIAPGNRNDIRDIAPYYEAGGLPAPYHTARIAAGLAEGAFDFVPEAVFPADINMDLAGGINFKKGCFVGQEVVSRMKRRGTARRRTLGIRLHGDMRLAPAVILAGGVEIGLVTSLSSTDPIGLARVRIDRMAEAEAAGEAFTANEVELSFDKPDWFAGELAMLGRAN